MLESESSRRLALLCATGVFVAMVQASVVPYVALHAGAVGAPPAVTGLIVALGFLLPLTIAIRIGKIVDRYGVHALLVVGSMLLVAGPIPVMVAPNPVTIVLLTVLVNLGHVTCVVASQRAVAQTVASRETAYGWFTTFVSLGQLIGPILLGQAIDSRGLQAGLGSLEFSALAALAFAVVTRFLIPRQAGRPSHAHPSIRGELRGNRAFLISIAGSGAVLFVLGVHQTFYPVVLDSMGVSAFVIGLILGARAVAAVLVRPLLALAIRWTGPAPWSTAPPCCAAPWGSRCRSSTPPF